MQIRLFVVALAAAAAVWVGVSAQQETRSTPGFGSGISKVEGTVDIGNSPTVKAQQAGEWRVSVAGGADVRVVNTPVVGVVGADFLMKGQRYVVVWPSGDRETVTIQEVRYSGWVQVDDLATGVRRWINLSLARAIESAPK